MKNPIITIFFLLSYTILSAQGLQLDWVRSFNNIETLSEGHAIISDELGNIYTLANAPDSQILFDADPDVNNEAQIEIPGTVLAKYTIDGEYIWSVSLGIAADGNFNIYGNLCLDEEGNVVVAGSFLGEVDFDPGINTEIVSSEFGAFFIAKYSSEGDLIWVKTMPSNNQVFLLIKGIDIDDDGNIYVGGSLQNNASPFELDFDAGPDQSIVSSVDIGTSFIAKYSSTGDFQFVKTIQGGNGGNQNRLIYLKLDSQNNIWITGDMAGQTDFDVNQGEFIVDETVKFIFLGKYDSDGNFIFVKTLTGSSSSRFCREIAIDAFDNVYITGEFRDTLFAGSESQLTELISETNSEPFIAKYSNGGELIYIFDLDSDPLVNNSNSPRTIVSDKLGYIYISGFLRRACDFDPGEAEFIITPQNAYEAFVAKYDEQGNLIYVFSTAGSSFTFVLDMEVNHSGQVILTGLFRNNADFDPGLNDTQTEGLSMNTMFISKYSPCYYSNDEADICEGDAYEAYTRILSEPGTYQVSYLSAEGCDSVVTLNLTVNPLPDNGVFVQDLELVCEQSGAEYQWFDCESNLPIKNAANQSFAPSDAQSYYATVTLNNCSVNTECASTLNVGIPDVTQSQFSIYPNPASSEIRVKCSPGSIVRIYNLEGKVINEFKAMSDSNTFKSLPESGMYIIQIQSGSSIVLNQKLIIE